MVKVLYRAYNYSNNKAKENAGGESYGRYAWWSCMDFIHSTWVLVCRTDGLCEQNYYRSNGNLVD